MKFPENKSFSYIIALLFIPLIVYPQKKEYEYIPFPTSDAIWSEIYSFKDDIHWQPPVYERFAVNGEDTVINTIVYKKIYMFLDTVFNKNTASYIGALREDEHKRIWLKMDTPLHPCKPAQIDNAEEILLYDFSVNEGDTITSEFLNITRWFWEEFFIVHKIDTIKIGNTCRKKIVIKHGFSEIGYPPHIVVEWIEGIGSPNGLFFASYSEIPIGNIEQNFLIGFKYKDEILYFNDNYSSFYPTGIEKQTVNSGKIRLLSIPGTGFMFEFDDKDTVSVIQIFNIAGILQTTLQKEFLLNTNNYIPGIYIYKAMNISGNNYTGKFIVR